MTLVPARFLIRVAHPCPFVKGIPRDKGERLLDLPESCRIDNFAGMDERRNFADVRVGWNEHGIGLQVQVTGKSESLQCDAGRIRGSDGVTLWIDTRDARGGHRATRYCHQFHFLPSGGGADQDDPVFAQTKINRALQDAPIASAGHVPFRSTPTQGGYMIEAFLPAGVLNGFDPEQNRRLGIFYLVRDSEYGEQSLGIGSEFPYWEDPSLWSVLELKD
jgi:hypothetical protein